LLVELCTISSPAPQWLLLVQASYDKDLSVQELIAKLALDPIAVPHCTLKGEILRYKTRIWVWSVPALQNQLITVVHASALGGHSSFLVTYKRLKNMLYWKGMKSDVQTFMKSCQVCLQAKPDRSSHPGKLQPLPIPSEAWETISMDFIESLPHSRSASCILVIVDKFTKLSHFITLAHPYTVSSMASVFMDVVYKLHGQTVAMVPDCDAVFTSRFW
jgi:hypothetical protein